jgi:hypothetical protein
MSNNANKIAERSLDSTSAFTQRMLEQSGKNFKIENRAFVFPSTPTKGFSWGKPVAKIEFVNCGKTPAYKFRQVLKYQYWHINIIEDPRRFSDPNDTTGMTLSPNFPELYNIGADTSRWDTNMSHHHNRLYLSGKIWYSDYWKRPHYFTFVYEWVSFDSSFVRHHEYESADTEQANQPNY